MSRYGDPQNMVEQLPEKPEWHQQARCRELDVNPDWFWAADGKPTERHYSHIERAKAVCAECPVLVECREHGVKNRESFGIWGGLTPAELRTERKRRSIKRTRSSLVA